MAKKNRKGRKKKTQQSSEASKNCGQCSKTLQHSSIDEPIPCVCTQVLYCSVECQRLGQAGRGQHQCPGPPAARINLNKGWKAAESQNESGIPASQIPAWHAERKRTVQNPALAFEQKHGVSRNAKEADVEFYARCADLGSGAHAYLAACLYKHRAIGVIKKNRQGDYVSDAANTVGQRGVLETNELAFYYFYQAAEAGIGIAMHSLSDCYMCRNWS